MKNPGVLTPCKSSPRVLLRIIEDRLYYSAPRMWVGDPDRAFNFSETPEAIRFAHDQRLDGVELVFSHDDPDLDVSFPLHPKKTVEEPVSWLETFCGAVEPQTA